MAAHNIFVGGVEEGKERVDGRGGEGSGTVVGPLAELQIRDGGDGWGESEGGMWPKGWVTRGTCYPG